MPCYDRTDEFRTLLHEYVKGDIAATQSLILPPQTGMTNDFMKAAQHIRQGIDEMKKFLESNKKEYLNVHRYLSSSASTMSDADRDSLDAEVRAYVQRTQKSIAILKNRIEEEKRAEQASHDKELAATDNKHESAGDHHSHQHGIVIILYDELKDVTTIMQTMAAIRTDQMREQAERLHPKSFHVTANIFTDEKKNAALVEALEEEKSRIEKPNDSLTLTEQEQALFEEEHDLLLHELVDNIDQIKRAERTVSEIGELVSEFSTRVMEQTDSIKNIQELNEQSVMHVGKGNEELKTWLQRSGEFRIMILFTLLMASISLLFVDWYYS